MRKRPVGEDGGPTTRTRTGEMDAPLAVLQRAPAPGRKLQKIGFILFFMPEPFGITNVIGGPLILAGRYLNKVYNGATLKDIGHETKKFASHVRDIKDKMR